MKHNFIILVFLLSNMILLAQNTGGEAAQIKQQMSAIRKSTNWSDPAAAKEANAKIESLSAKLTQALRQNNSAQQQPQGNNETPSDANVKNEMQQKLDDYNSKLMNQMMKIVREGDEGNMDLAKPLREEIVEAYNEDQSPKNINQEVLNSVTFLRIDMSLPTVQRTIDVMQNFKAIKTLLITGGAHGAPVDLESILNKAVNYPLKTLYIINFRQFVSSIPSQINDFHQLETVALFNNNLDQLPAMDGFASSLDSLFIDINPVSSLFPHIKSLTSLKKLGVAQTSISEAEIKQIQLLLPKCKILL